MNAIKARILLEQIKPTHLNNKNMTETINLAIQALNKQIPTSPKIQSYCPALCPSCGNELSEDLDDGYYKHYYGLSICECGQKLKWSD